MSKVSEFRAQTKTPPNGVPKGDPVPTNLPYNPRDFLVPATGKNKQPPQNMQFKCQQGHAHEAAKIVAARIFPYYDTVSDLIRHGTQRHLAYLHTLGAPITTEWLQTEAMIELMRDEQRQHDFKGYLDELDATVEKSVRAGMASEARILVHKIRLLVAQMSEGKWKERWVREIMGRFAGLEEPAANRENP